MIGPKRPPSACLAHARFRRQVAELDRLATQSAFLRDRVARMNRDGSDTWLLSVDTGGAIRPYIGQADGPGGRWPVVRRPPSAPPFTSSSYAAAAAAAASSAAGFLARGIRLAQTRRLGPGAGRAGRDGT